MSIYQPVKPDVSLPKLEEDILSYWDQNRIFEKSLDLNTKPYSFYDGPPFATGLPHYGHLLAGVLKDIVPRYWTMKGHVVHRRFGWDCHGLPVEYEINKKHNLHSRKEIIAMGVDKYNAACRSIVTRYTGEWKKTVRRIGRWVDMENAYYTMDVSFMQSVWWVFQELFKKGLIYEGYKVVPYSVGISTPLSNFEANLNYKDVQDPAITITFPVVGEQNTFFIAWTTTPWTLPSNLALAIGKDIEYVKIRDKADGKKYILAKALVGTYYKDPASQTETLDTIRGDKLIGMEYVPLFDYFLHRKNENLFKVIPADHVTTESGTGIVHIAPAYGEEDYLACSKYNIPVINPVDDDGQFTAEVADYQGRMVKDADKDIIARLKQSGRLIKHETIVHSYPYCWRSDTPLIYRAVSSWFVAVEKIKDRIIAANKTTAWIPETLRDGRFGNWLENARDWAISRNRFWGTPIPIWRNPEGEIICIGSRDELEKFSGAKVNDLHMDVIDKITIPSPTGKSPLRRIEAVLDCWFESGSMPFAQWGYPHQNKEEFEKNFPADFIAEGLDQTRGWFYTLMVLGAALFDKAPFKNVVVNGLVLAEDGKKMSKSLRNYPDPALVLDKHGADALRLYLIDSPVVKAQELRFSEKGVTEIVRRILLRWWNAYSFFVNYAEIDGFKPRGDCKNTPNILDRWVLSRLNSLIAHTQKEMNAYRLYNVVPGLLQFIENLTNTYIRFNRSHFWQEGMPESKRFAYETLHETLVTLSRLMAPFAPFLSEAVYLNLSRVNKNPQESVHLEKFPEADESLRHPELEEAVRSMETLVMLGRNMREKIGVKAKIPLKLIRIIHRDKKVLENLRKFEPYFAGELNIQKIEYEADEDKFIQISVKPNFPVLGKRLGAKMKAIAGAMQKLPLSAILELESRGEIVVDGERITQEDVEIRRAAKGSNPNLSAHQLVSIEIDPTVTPEQIKEGLAREIIRRVQATRKAADFKLDDRIELEIFCEGDLRAAAEAFRDMICSETLATSFIITAEPKGVHIETADVDDATLKIGMRVIG
ncbi:MAG: isoleucine--tRNA ligase [Bdellovibrionales bacterium RIFOXYD1_FULL_53_11]|nr:MAG: isoleucine--tRNA ligase [Bdellovibrionales bacterium RIFOXYD1_FULL_53_11]